MKTFLTLTLMTTCLYANAQQTPKRNYFLQPSFDTEVLASAEMANGNHIIVCKAGSYWFFGSEGIQFFCYDAEGALLWSKSGQIGAERIINTVITPLPDNYFVLWNELSGCDFGIPPLWAFFGPDGTLLWSGENYLDFALELPVLPFDQHSFLIYSPDAAGYFQFKYSQQGIELVGIVDGIPSYNQGYLPLPSGDVVLSLGANTLRQCGNGLTLKKEVSFAHQLLDYDALPGGRLAVLFSDSLAILDSTWQEKQTVLLPNKGMELSATNNRVYLTTNHNGIKKLTVLDSALQVTTTLAIPTEIPTPHIESSEHSLFLFGTSQLDKQNKAMMLKTLPGNSMSFETEGDLSVVDIHFHDTVRYHLTNWGPAIFQGTDFGKVSVTVRNVGNKSVESYHLKFRTYYCPSVCAGEVNISHLESNRHLLPGEEETVVFSNNLVLDCTFPLSELCVWVNAPNEAPDESPENNRFCKNFSALLGESEANQNIALRISPNPSTGVVHLPELPAAAEFNVINVTGKLMLNGRVESSTIDCSGLPDGLYQVCLHLDTGKMLTGRFVLLK